MSELNEKILYKSCKILHTNLINTWDTIPSELYPYNVDYQVEYKQIYDFIVDKLFVEDYENIKQIFLYFIYNYNEDGDYSVTEYPEINYGDLVKQSPNGVAVASQYIGVLPFFVVQTLLWDYGEVPVYNILTEDEDYAIGTYSQIMAAMKHDVVDRFFNETEVISIFGLEYFLMFCNVSEVDKRNVSSEYSRFFVESLADTDLISYLEDSGENSELLDEYMELKEYNYESTPSEVVTKYSKRMGEIINQSRDIVREFIYEEIYEKLSDDATLIDFLMEENYIFKKGGYLEVASVKKLPNWLIFDWDSFSDDQLDNYEISHLSPYDEYYTFDWKGDTYYIYKTTY